jgi:hypothetical protein
MAGQADYLQQLKVIEQAFLRTLKAMGFSQDDQK